MKKRILIWTLVIGLCASVAPVSILATNSDHEDEMSVETVDATSSEIAFEEDAEDEIALGEDTENAVIPDDEADLSDGEDTAAGDDTDGTDGAEDDAEVSDGEEGDIEGSDGAEDDAELSAEEGDDALSSEDAEAASDEVAEDEEPAADEITGIEPAEAEEPGEDEEELAFLAAGETDAFAVYSATDTSLTFYYGTTPETGSDYKGKTATAVYTGLNSASFSGSSSVSWSSYRSAITSVVIDDSFSAAQPTSMAYWFYNVENATFTGLENLDTSQVKSMAYLFAGCTNFTDGSGLGSWNTANVTDMHYMFQHCENLVTVDLSSFNTSQVTTFQQMFAYCKSLTSVDVSSFDTSSATSINGMFRQVENMTEITIGVFNTGKVTQFNAMFRDSPKLETIYVDQNWDFSSITNGVNMFVNCDALVGGNGTKCLASDGSSYKENATEVGYEMANIDTTSNPGYFTDVRSLSTEDISGSKVWDDADDQDGIRPGSVTVILEADGVEADRTVVTEAEDWSFVFLDMPKYDGDLNEITYTVTEETVDGYTCAVTGDVENGFVITNSHTPSKTDVSGTIVWDDGGNQDGIRPSFVTVQLFAKDESGGILDSWEFEVRAPEEPVYDAEDREVWMWTLSDLDQYFDGGKNVKYTVVLTGVEVSDEAYAQTWVDDLNAVYSYTPETITISGSKTWVDDDNQENIRPENITIRLHANSGIAGEIIVSAAEGWAWTFEDLPVYENGHPIDYHITEDAVSDYETEYTFGEDGSYNVTNTLHPGATSVSVEKIWDDAENQDGKRPESVTVSLLRATTFDGDGNPTDWEQATDVDGNAAVLTLTADNHWEGTFTEIAEYEDGVKIFYTVQEVETGGNDYATEIVGDMSIGFTITNSYEPEITAVTGEKIWDDADDQDGIRPSSLYIHLLADGVVVDDAELTADQNDTWSFAFTGIPKYADGIEIAYSVEEVLDTHLGDAYTGEITGDAEDGYIITNKHEPELINDDGTLTVTKVWDDDDDRDGLRPAEVTVRLWADGTEVGTATLGSEAEPSGLWQSVVRFFRGVTTWAAEDEDEWTASFTELPKYADGEEILYTVTEDEIEGYTAALTGSVADGYTITNTHTPETINISGIKVWDDADDQDGIRPDSITINLLADGAEATDKSGDALARVVRGEDEDDWEWAFVNLYRYRDGGTEIDYTMQEDTSALPEGYTTTMTGDMTHGFTITNSYEPELVNGDGTLRIVLVWDDEADNDGIRPTEVHVTLTKDNVAVEGAELILTANDADADDNWIGAFTELPKYEDGSEIQYSVTEDVSSGYTYRIELKTDGEGNTYVELTNVHVSVKENIEITKIWDDADDQDGKRPDSVTVSLLLNDSLYQTQVLTAETDGVEVSEGGKVWTYTMEDVPVDKGGTTGEYTVLEAEVDGYDTPVIETIRGDEVTENGVTYSPYSFVVTNSHTPEQIDITGTKVWDDANDQDGKRPQFVTLHLYADGVEVSAMDVTAPEEDTGDTGDTGGDEAESWAWAFTGFDKYADGKEILYTVEEEAVTDYVTTILGDAASGFSITNSYTPETTSVSGSKTWVDEENAYDTRPASITVRLHANGEEEVYEQTVTEADGWAWEFTDVPVCSNGSPIVYTLTEDAVEDYDTTYTFGADGTLDVTNTLAAGTTSLSVEKDWEDGNDQDGIRPQSVTVALLRDGTETGQTLTLSGENDWTDTFGQLEKYDNGTRIDYTVAEVVVEGYDCVVTGNADEGYVITNTHTPEIISVSGSKVWEDGNDQDGIRPASVTIRLLADGVAVESQSVTADDWTWTFSDLPKYADGTEIVYTMEEQFVADGYEVTPGDASNDFTFTNTHEPATIDIAGTKTWDDDDDRDGKRPGSITVRLLADDVTVGSQTVTANDGWTYTFAELDQYANGEEIAYQVVEEVPEGYEASYTYFDYDVTNTHDPALFNGDGTLGVILRWDDEDDQDGLRPKRTTITLTVNGVADENSTLLLSDDNVDEDGNWIGAFTDLYRYADGAEIAYNVEEGVMNGYTYTAELLYDEDTGLWYVEITYIHAAVTSDITVTKVWDDSDDQDGIRPDSVIVSLFSNGSEVKSVTITPGKENVDVSDDGNAWTYTFTDMPVDQNGESIVYTLEEADVDSYTHVIETTTVEGNEQDGVAYSEYAFTVTNSHTPETTEVSGEKLWEDGDDQDGVRPNSVTIELLADGGPALDETGTAITQAVTPHTDGSWTWTFTDIPKYRDGGEEIVYTFAESQVDGYDTTVSADGLTITNTYEPATTSISGNKVWDDSDDQDRKRPESITVSLYANGSVYETKTVTEADGWEWEFTDLPVYANGQKITYVTTEAAIADYDTTYSGFTLTNTYEPGKTSVTVIADWEDEDDRDGIRPTGITVTLLADGAETGQTLTLTGDENGIWEGTFRHLDEYSDGVQVAYTVAEVTVDGYDCVISGDAETGFLLTFTHEPETVEISGSKVWDDADDQDGLRPDEITVHLLADGEEILTGEVEPVAAGPLRKLGAALTFGAVFSAEDDWSFTFSELPKYEDGREITYTITESAVSGYDTTVTGNAADGFEIVNTHIPETMTISGTKVWRDEDDRDGKRPESITVRLQADDRNAESLAVTGDGDTWEWSFPDVPKYADGETIEYTVSEAAVSEYDTAMTGDALSGYTIINSHTPETLTITGSKTWDDEENQDGHRPDSVTIRLHQNGEVIASRTVTAYDGWTWTFSNQPKYENGQEISYTVTEDAVDEYSATVDGYDVTNAYTPGQTSLMVTKDWEDANDQDGLRPNRITVELLADGVPTGQTLTLREANQWTDTFRELDEYESGIRIAYTVAEVAVDGYTGEQTGNATEGFVITNTHEPETLTISGTKIWVDEEDRDGKRPESITVSLLNQNGKTADTQTVTAEDDWTWNFTVSRYAAGSEVDYSGSSVEEVAVENYSTEITGNVTDGFVLTNTHEPELINMETHVLSVSLRWNDDEDAEGLRPYSVTLTLMANGEAVTDENGTVLTLTLDASSADADGNWVGEFDLSGIDLYRYKDGLEIRYTIDETDENGEGLAADGYTARTLLVYDEETGTWHLEVTNSLLALAEEEDGEEEEDGGDGGYVESGDNEDGDDGNDNDNGNGGYVDSGSGSGGDGGSGSSPVSTRASRTGDMDGTTVLVLLFYLAVAALLVLTVRKYKKNRKKSVGS